MEPRKAIINADDFGHNKSVCEGIKIAYENGIITSTSTMGNLLDESESLENLIPKRIAKPQIGIGVHLNITYGPPLLIDEFKNKIFDRPLRDSGKPEEWLDSVWKSHFLKYDKNDIEKEYIAQIEKVTHILGKPDHLDSHNSSASYSPAKEIYVKLAYKYSLPIRPSAPLTENPIFGGDLQTDYGFIKKMRKIGIKTVDSADLRYYYQLENPYDIFRASLAEIKPGEVKEFMFHPCVDDSMGKWRLFDMDFVTNIRTIQIIKDLGVKLTTYKESAK